MTPLTPGIARAIGANSVTLNLFPHGVARAVSAEKGLPAQRAPFGAARPHGGSIRMSGISKQARADRKLDTVVAILSGAATQIADAQRELASVRAASLNPEPSVGSCWDQAPSVHVHGVPECVPALCELPSGHPGAHRAGRREWMKRGPESSTDVREALVDVLVMTRLSDYAGTDMTAISQAADAILARFHVAPKTTDRPDGGTR